MTSMLAACYDRFGGPDVLELREVPLAEPGPGEVRVEVAAASINPLDWKLLRGDFRWFRPRVKVRRLGCDFAGRVHAIGPGVTTWQLGDEVFGSLGPLAGREGALGQFLLIPAAGIVRKPATVDFAEAATLPMAGGSAAICLRLTGVRAGHEVLVIGAAGGVGSFCVQAAVVRGARVTAVCGSRNAEQVRQLGAAEIIARDREDLFDQPRQFDAIIDAAAAHSFAHCAPLLRPKGSYVTTLPGPGVFLAVLRTKLFGGKRAHALMAKVTPALLQELAALTANEKFRPLISARFDLKEVRQALALSATGHAVGKIVVIVKP